MNKRKTARGLLKMPEKNSLAIPGISSNGGSEEEGTFLTTAVSDLCLLFFIVCALFPCTARSSDLVPLVGTGAGQEKGVPPEVILAIEVEGLTRIKQEEFEDMISVNLGDSLDRDVIAAGIKRAFLKGIFSDIEVVREPYHDGIRLRYIVRELPVISDILVQGNKGISKKRIRDALFFRKGENFREDLLEKAVRDLKGFYARKGFPDCSIDLGVKGDRTAGHVRIVLKVREGDPLIIRDIETLPAVKDIMGLSAGDRYDRDVADEDVKRVKDHFAGKRHIKPLVGPYEFKGGVLRLPVVPGPQLEVVFKGNREATAKNLMSELSFEGEEINEDLLRERVEVIKRFYQKRGYKDVQVSGAIEEEANIWRITFFIFEGEKVLVKDINFEGITLSPDVLGNIVPLREGGPYERGLLDDSRDSIERFYNALGYLRAGVRGVREEFIEGGRAVRIVFTVSEGALITLGKVEITGNNAIGTDEIRGVLRIHEGAPYNDIDIGDARYRIISLYHQHGYSNAAVDVERSFRGDAIFVTYAIAEHEPFTFGKFIITGNTKTKDKIIKREFRVREGDPYDYTEIFGIKNRLYKLGLFRSVSIEPIETAHTGKKEVHGEKAREQDLLIRLDEGNAGSVEVGIGYGDYERMRGYFDISYRNLWGYSRQISLRSELSSIKERYVLLFKEPWFLNKPSLPLTVSLTKEKIRSIDIDSRDVKYKIDRAAFLAGVDKEFSAHLKGVLNYEYSLVETTDVRPGVILSREDTGTVGISSISPSLFYDTRDNPFDPSSGSLKGITLKLASKVLFSETDFLKAVFQGSWYVPLKKGLVLAFAVKGGVAHGFGETVELPIVERFFLGGRTTVRGYDHDSLGPKGEKDTPTGGNVFALLNGELRVSVGKGFGFVTFVDAGNVWQKIEDVEPELRFTYGLGLRYNTPVGPIRIDYGHKWEREEGESPGEVHFSVGHAF